MQSTSPHHSNTRLTCWHYPNIVCHSRIAGRFRVCSMRTYPSWPLTLSLDRRPCRRISEDLPFRTYSRNKPAERRSGTPMVVVEQTDDPQMKCSLCHSTSKATRIHRTHETRTKRRNERKGGGWVATCSRMLNTFAPYYTEVLGRRGGWKHALGYKPRESPPTPWNYPRSTLCVSYCGAFMTSTKKM